jgi:tetratricopeptide (TPR) repeat protein
MMLSDEDRIIVDNLLSTNNEIVISALALPLVKLSDAVYKALVLVWQLNPDENLQNAAKDKLDDFHDFSQLVAINNHFEIFRSLNEVMPWTDASAAEIQHSNFELFSKQLLDYELLLTSYSLYAELLLDAGRKLLLIFQLEGEAKSCFEIIVKYNPENDEALYALGRMEERQGNSENALNYYERAIAANPDNSFAQMQTGILKKELFQKYEEALHHFSKASESDPYSVDPYVKMAEASYKMGNIPQTRQFLEIALGINEYHEEALNLLGILQWKIEENYEAAVETFKKGIDHKIHEDSALLLKSLGDIYAEHFQDFKMAKLFYEKSLKSNPAQKILLEYYVPLVLKQFQDLGAVEKAYADFLNLRPNDADMLTAFANFLCDYLNDFDSAYNYLERAVEVTPNHQAALKLLRKISDYVDTSINKNEDLEDEEDDENVIIDVIELDDDWNDDEDNDEDDDDFSGGGAAGDN